MRMAVLLKSILFQAVIDKTLVRAQTIFSERLEILSVLFVEEKNELMMYRFEY